MNSDKVELEKKYIPLFQKPFCCNVTCLQMILYRRGYGLYDQQELAKKFGVRIQEKDKSAFNVELGTFSHRNYDEGLKTVESEDKINRFFRENDISLKAEAVKASQIEDLKDFLISHLRKNHDLWVEYKSKRIHSENSIHDGLVESIYPDRSEAVLTDPKPEHKPRITVSLEDLEEAISDKFSRETGFIIVKSA